MFLKKGYHGKGQIQREEFKYKYRNRMKICIGYLPLREVLYEGKIYKVRIRCEKKFWTTDPTKVFCNDSCRLNFHYERRKLERSMDK